MHQHVASPTHCRENNLDFVVASVTGSVLTDMSAESLLTDHHIMSWHARRSSRLTDCRSAAELRREDSLVFLPAFKVKKKATV